MGHHNGNKVADPIMSFINAGDFNTLYDTCHCYGRINVVYNFEHVTYVHAIHCLVGDILARVTTQSMSEASTGEHT